MLHREHAEVWVQQECGPLPLTVLGWHSTLQHLTGPDKMNQRREFFFICSFFFARRGPILCTEIDFVVDEESAQGKLFLLGGKTLEV